MIVLSLDKFLKQLKTSFHLKYIQFILIIFPLLTTCYLTNSLIVKNIKNALVEYNYLKTEFIKAKEQKKYKFIVQTVKGFRNYTNQSRDEFFTAALNEAPILSIFSTIAEEVYMQKPSLIKLIPSNVVCDNYQIYQIDMNKIIFYFTKQFEHDSVPHAGEKIYIELEKPHFDHRE
jgi:hypothetical protein